jgi:hypothetical protein
MEIVLLPDPGDDVNAAVVAALAREGVDLGDEPPAYRSPWRKAGFAEGVERAPSTAVRPDYNAFSPRSTRGATRA